MSSKVPISELDEKAQEWYMRRFVSRKIDSRNIALRALVDPSYLTLYGFGDGKQILSPYFKKHKDMVKHLEIRDDDVWIFGFPRSGTTLTQEMVWLLDHNLDFDTAAKVKLNYRCVFIDGAFFTPEGHLQDLREKLAAENFDYFDIELLLNRPSPRHYKTHMFFELFPDNLVEKAKVFYLAREVKDVIVSIFHFEKLSGQLEQDVEFKPYCLDFIEDRVLWGPYFTHLKEGWSKRHHKNVMFMFYEDIVKDLPGTIQKVSQFLGKDYSEEQLEALHQHLRFDNMKNNKAVLPADICSDEYIKKEAQPFIRKGKPGGWRDYFDDELLEKTNAWIARNLAGTDIAYPTSK